MNDFRRRQRCVRLLFPLPLPSADCYRYVHDYHRFCNGLTVKVATDFFQETRSIGTNALKIFATTLHRAGRSNHPVRPHPPCPSRRLRPPPEPRSPLPPAHWPTSAVRLTVFRNAGVANGKVFERSFLGGPRFSVGEPKPGGRMALQSAGGSAPSMSLSDSLIVAAIASFEMSAECRSSASADIAQYLALLI